MNHHDKERHEVPELRRRPARRAPRFWAFVGVGLLLVALQIHSGRGTWFPLASHSKQREETGGLFNWDELPTKAHLEYTPCYNDEFQCARLELPMDYWNGTTDATISLAVIRKPAVVPVTHPQYGGAILLNPGGPGGSGVAFLRGSGKAIRGIVDTADGDEGKFFDLISFDPRGIVRSTPSIQCFSDPMQETSWEVRMNEEGLLSSSDAAFGRIWSMSVALSRSCSLPPPDGRPNIKKYVSTASVARDMLEIVERHGEWREKEAKHLLARSSSCRRRVLSLLNSASHSAVMPEHLMYRPNEEKIQYWGFSYGTVLGNTFAAMFGDRIERLVVDGVVDIYDYKKTLWFDNLLDTEKELGMFYYHCARVGYPTCLLANETGKTTAEGVKQRTQAILESLYHNPLPVIGESAEVVTYSHAKGYIFSSLYKPIEMFPVIANGLAGIEKGNGSVFAELNRPGYEYQCPSDSDSSDSGRSTYGFMAIACSDGDDQTGLTRADWAEHVKNITKVSPGAGEIWSLLRLQCINYGIRPVHRFEGPWEGKTSHPILEVGNTADPVTPGRFAKKMAKGFKGAVALLQDSPGHCSLAASSRCTQRYIQRYFQTGELPPEDTLCDVDELPFGPGADELAIVDTELEKARERRRQIAESMFAAGGGFMPKLAGSGVFQ